ncbi:hypothetical protein [Kribbella sp. NPDC023855]|uniref:hypothetical protein n=1 Tax=Kribbella sp. NPDC023855 TaxID=3154698 RepID=UPI00340E90A9
MRKPLAVAAAALMLLGSIQLPAQAAGPEAPTDLQISWVSPANKLVKMTWADGGEANIVRVEYQDGHQVTRFTSKPGTPNEWTRAGEALVAVDRVARISVVSIDAAGAESAPVVSPWFDSIGAPLPTFTSAVPLADSSLKLNWSLAPVPVDTTPGDPLDLPSTGEVVKLAVATTPNAPGKSFTLPAGTTTLTIPPHPRPYPVDILTTNEWAIRGGYSGSSRVVFNETAVGLSVPATNVYSQSLPFSIVAGTRLCANAQVNCPDPANPFVANPGIRTFLQARPDATRPWKTIGTYANQQLRFIANVRLYGGQQYRLYIPSWSHLNGRELTVAPAASTSARYSATQAKFAVVGFNTSTAAVGQIVKTTVDVLPAGTVKADLQWYDGKVWRHATYISLTKGKGTFSFKAAGRGTSRYWRVVVPKMTMNGLPIVATASKPFKLTVR